MARQWVRASEAARRLGVSIWTVYSLAKRGRLTYRRDDDTGTWRIDAASIDAYDRARTVAARALAPELVAAAARTPSPDEPWRGSIFGPKSKGRRRHSRRAAI